MSAPALVEQTVLTLCDVDVDVPLTCSLPGCERHIIRSESLVARAGMPYCCEEHAAMAKRLYPFRLLRRIRTATHGVIEPETETEIRLAQAAFMAQARIVEEVPRTEPVLLPGMSPQDRRRERKRAAAAREEWAFWVGYQEHAMAELNVEVDLREGVDLAGHRREQPRRRGGSGFAAVAAAAESETLGP